MKVERQAVRRVATDGLSNNGSAAVATGNSAGLRGRGEEVNRQDGVLGSLRLWRNSVLLSFVCRRKVEHVRVSRSFFFGGNCQKKQQLHEDPNVHPSSPSATGRVSQRGAPAERREKLKEATEGTVTQTDGVSALVSLVCSSRLFHVLLQLVCLLLPALRARGSVFEPHNTEVSQEKEGGQNEESWMEEGRGGGEGSKQFHPVLLTL